MRKVVITLIFLMFLPQITLAAWWKPLSWFNNWNFLRKQDPETEALGVRIKELEKKLEEISKTTATSSHQATTTSNDLKVGAPSPKVVIPKVEAQIKIMPTLTPVVANKDYEQIYSDLRYQYSEFRPVVILEKKYYDNIKLTNTQLHYWEYLRDTIKVLNDDITYLSQFDKKVPKPASIIDSYVAKLVKIKDEYYRTKKSSEVDQRNDETSAARNSVVDYIRVNKYNLHIPSYHVTAATLLEYYDEIFKTNYATSFKATKTQVEVVEFSNSFLIDLGESTN